MRLSPVASCIVLIATAFLSMGAASFDGPLTPIPPETAPKAHGDILQQGVYEEPSAPSKPAIVVPILRERLDGTPELGYQVLTGELTEMVARHLQASGIPTISLAELGSASHRKFAVPEEALQAAIEDFPWADWMATVDHPVAPITDYTEVPVTLYADSAMQAISNWQTKVHDAWTVAHVEIYDEASVHLERYLLMTTGTPSADVADYCGTMQTGDYELGFIHRGYMVMLFSPGPVGSSDGVTLNGPLSAQIAGEQVTTVKWWYDWCAGAWSQTTRMASTYVRDSPDAAYMGRLSAHEAAHVLNTAHADGDCYSGGATHWHRTIMTMTTSSDVEPDCQTSDASTFAHYHDEFSAASIDKMWAERQRWTACINFGC